MKGDELQLKTNKYIDFLKTKIITKEADKIMELAKMYCPHIFRNEEYADFLSFAARWMQFSVLNIVLLYKQMPGASYVCSLREWEGYALDQGFPENYVILPPHERKNGIKLLLPFTVNPVNNQKGPYLSYRKVLVYDKSQVNGITAPEGISLKTNILNLETKDFVRILRETFGPELSFTPVLTDSPIIRFSRAQYYDNTVYYDSAMNSTEMNKSLLKETICHMVRSLSEDLKESDFYLFSVYYILLQCYEIQERTPPFSYFETCADKDGDELLLILHRIMKTAQQLIKRLYTGYYSFVRRGTDEVSMAYIEKFKL